MNRIILCIGVWFFFACNQDDPMVLLSAYDLSNRSVAAGTVYENVNNEMAVITDIDLINDFNSAIGVRLFDKESPFNNTLYERIEFDGNGMGQIWLATEDNPLSITYKLSGEVVGVNIEELNRVVEFKLSNAGKQIENCSYIIFNHDRAGFFDFEFLLYGNCEGLNPNEFLNMQIAELPDTVGATAVMTSNM